MIQKSKKFVVGRNLSFTSSNPEGELEVVNLEEGDTLIVQPATHNVEDMPTNADVLEVAPPVAPEMPVEPLVEPEAVPALASARRRLRPAVASQARQSIRARIQDFRSSAMKGSTLAAKR